MVKSLYLSVDRFAGRDDGSDEHPQLQKDLSQAQTILKRGDSIEYDQEELSKIQATSEAVDQVQMRHVFQALFKLFLPAFVILGLLLLAIFILGFFPRIDRDIAMKRS